MKFDSKLFALFLVANIASCQSKTENNVSQYDTKTTSDEVRIDSLEMLADLQSDAHNNAKVERPLTIQSTGWAADKKLRTVRYITLKNVSEKKIIGVSLIYIMSLGKGTEVRDVGKFRLSLKPASMTTLTVHASKFGVSDKIIERPSWADLAMYDKVVASTIYFEDGSTDTYDAQPVGYRSE